MKIDILFSPSVVRTARLLAILAAGAFLTWWQVRQTDRAMRASLLEKTRIVEHAVNVNRLRRLTGTAADLNKPEYLRLKDELAATCDADPQCRFIYLLGRRADGTIFFFVDSEPAVSKASSPAGQVYEEASDGCRRVFASHVGIVEGPTTDRWGTWVSGLLPIFDRQQAQTGAGDLIAMLGMDIDVRAWNELLARAALPPILLTLVLAAVVVLGSKLLDMRARLAAESPAWMRHIEPAMVVALGFAVTLFATWAVHKREAAQRVRIFEQLASSQATIVGEILRDIRDSELNGLARFCEGNQMASPEGFEKFSSTLTKNPAVQVWAWVPAVPAAAKSRFEEAAHTTGGMPDFEIWRQNGLGLRIPASYRQTYYPVFCLAPPQSQKLAVGYDLGSELPLNAAIKVAAYTGLVTASDPVTLFQNAADEKSMVICHPVYGGGESKALRGFALAVLRMDLLLCKSAANSEVLLELSLLRKNEHREVLASNFASNSQPATGISVTHPFFAFGKVFAVTAHPGPGALRQTGADWLTALAGLSLTALLATVASLRRRQGEVLERPSRGEPAL